MSSQHVTVSVVLVNFRGADDTITAISSLDAIDRTGVELEIVVVENASGDDSAARIRDAAPHVVLVESAENTGFAGGCNLGVAHARGEIVAFLNNDARPDDAWISAAIMAFADPEVGAVASRVLDWDGELVDYIGSGLSWFGMGYKPLTGERVPRVPPAAGDVLFGTGSAMFVRREVFEELGGFEPRFFMFFEDVDFGWRLNLRGWRFRYEPDSLAFHRHHGSMGSFGDHQEQYLLERNALFCLYRNASQEVLAEALPAALALAVHRGVAKAELDSESLDLRRGGRRSAEPVEVAPILLSSAFAIDRFVEELPWLRASRDEIQASRRVSDRALWPLFGRTDVPAYDARRYLEGYEKVVEAFDVVEEPQAPRVLVITGDPLGERLAGPAIRAWNIAQHAAPRMPVRLMSLTGVAEGLAAPFELVHVAPGDEAGFAPHEAWADVIVFQGHAMAVFDGLRDSSKVLVVDVYDPMHLEQLEQAKSLGPADWNRHVLDATEVLNEQLRRGDFFLAASERQRSFWLGQLAALGRVNPANYAADADLRRLLSVVPFGLPDDEPVHDERVVKGVVPGVGADDKLLLWGGGLYDWFDPESLIRAVALVAERRPEVKLYFQGTKHPHPGVPEMPIVARSRELASTLGVLDRNVFFNASWVEYARRGNFLAEADAGVSTHFAHTETTYSFRTRILDYLWGGLPMVVTRGDHFGDLVEREGLGVAVDPEDVAGLAAAIERVLFDEDFARSARDAIARVREEYRWSNVLRPLMAFLDDPRPAADRIASGAAAFVWDERPRRRRKRSGLRHDFGLAVFYLRNGGMRTVAEKVRSRLGRRA